MNSIELPFTQHRPSISHRLRSTQQDGGVESAPRAGTALEPDNYSESSKPQIHGTASLEVWIVLRDFFWWLMFVESMYDVYVYIYTHMYIFSGNWDPCSYNWGKFYSNLTNKMSLWIWWNWLWRSRNRKFKAKLQESEWIGTMYRTCPHLSVPGTFLIVRVVTIGRMDSDLLWTSSRKSLKIYSWSLAESTNSKSWNSQQIREYSEISISLAGWIHTTLGTCVPRSYSNVL